MFLNGQFLRKNMFAFISNLAYRKKKNPIKSTKKDKDDVPKPQKIY